MASRNELANEYFKRISNSLNKESEIKKVLNEINKLTYSEGGKSITKEDKTEIVLAIIRLLDNKYSKYFNFSGGGEILNERQEIDKAFSNDNYLDLISQIKAQTKK